MASLQASRPRQCHDGCRPLPLPIVLNTSYSICSVTAHPTVPPPHPTHTTPNTHHCTVYMQFGDENVMQVYIRNHVCYFITKNFQYYSRTY